MILIYLDESGDTGTNLRDPQQPIFVLGAMLIPEKKWKTIETEYWNLITEIYDKKIPNDFELHAIDLVNRKGSFSMFSLEEAKNIRNKILQFIKDFEVNIFYRKIEKKKYQLYCEKQFGVGIKIDPYIMAFPYISWKVEETLSQNNEMGIFIFDEHRSVLDIEQSIKSLRLEESDLKLNRVIEKGFFINSKKSFPLQLLDLVLYYLRKWEEHKIGKEVSAVHQETFSVISQISESLDNHPKGKEILNWVGKRVKEERLPP